jgi:hypothetical protein
MYKCFGNVRQTNEKIEVCVKKEETKHNIFNNEMGMIYKNNLVKIYLNFSLS